MKARIWWIGGVLLMSAPAAAQEADDDAYRAETVLIFRHRGPPLPRHLLAPAAPNQGGAKDQLQKKEKQYFRPPPSSPVSVALWLWVWGCVEVRVLRLQP